ncbi:hypothetical protein [Pseudanabaena sp. BC1403]|uniref:hypothetical protein n=1 Tax=Pseudanabaena sp. BC1403 TaxID=2043171 RepID=UPI000CD97A11|nr:hypothetical protein [Pseudanabaena sp. BC1403]
MATQTDIEIENANPILELGHVNVQTIRELIADSINKEPAKNATKEELLQEVKQLVDTQVLSRDLINAVIREHKFAGKVSVCLGMPLEYKSLTKQQLDRLLRHNQDNDPFTTELHPQLTQKPSFNSAEWLSDTKLRLEFTYAGKSYELEDNYQLRKITPTKRIDAYIRLLDRTFLVETRASIRETKLLHASISRLLGIEVAAMTFSDNDMAFLKRELIAKSRASKYKLFGGDLDTVYVSASPTLDDLESSEEFREKFSDGELRETRLEFFYTKHSGHLTKVSLHISHQGNIWFMSDVAEEVIEYVLLAVRKIKFLPPISKLRRSTKENPEINEQIETLLYAIRANGYGSHFSPRIYQTLGIQVQERSWIESISKLVQAGFLSESFELCCPACHETIAIYQSYKDLPLDREISCDHCGHNFTVSESDIFLTYAFKEDLITQPYISVIEHIFPTIVEESFAK